MLYNSKTDQEINLNFGLLSETFLNINHSLSHMTNYTATHSASDMPGVVIDFLVEYGIQLLAFAGLIALVTLFVWAKKQM